MKMDSLSILLHFAVHPAVPLVGDEQDDDIALVEGEQCVVVTSSVGEDGTNAWLLHHVVEAGGDRYRPGEAAIVSVPMVCRRNEGRMRQYRLLANIIRHKAKMEKINKQ